MPPPPPQPPTDQEEEDQGALLRSCTEAQLRARGLLPATFPPAPRSAADARAALRAALALSFSHLVAAAQAEIDRLGYNQCPNSYHHPVDKRLPFRLLAARAAAALHDPAPLKCVEAVALALALTAGLPGVVDRLALGFRSRDAESGKRHRHVVLALRDSSGAEGWAAVGASRRPELLGGQAPSSPGGAGALPSLSSLVTRYAAGYKAVGHVLEKVRVGFPAPHSLRCARRVSWRRLRLTLPAMAAAGAVEGGDEGQQQAWRLVASALDAFAACPGRAVMMPPSSPCRRDTDASLASTLSLLSGDGGGGASAASASVLAPRA